MLLSFWCDHAGMSCVFSIPGIFRCEHRREPLNPGELPQRCDDYGHSNQPCRTCRGGQQTCRHNSNQLGITWPSSKSERPKFDWLAKFNIAFYPLNSKLVQSIFFCCHIFNHWAWISLQYLSPAPLPPSEHIGKAQYCCWKWNHRSSWLQILPLGLPLFWNLTQSTVDISYKSV